MQERYVLRRSLHALHGLVRNNRMNGRVPYPIELLDEVVFLGHDLTSWLSESSHQNRYRDLGLLDVSKADYPLSMRHSVYGW